MIKYICLLILIFSTSVFADSPYRVPRMESLSVGIPVNKLPYANLPKRPGWEERGPEYTNWLACSVKIPSSGGSGTMVYCDDFNNYVYVISAGHLFPAGRFRMIRGSKKTATIQVFYQGGEKLPQAKSYEAEVLCSVWASAYDVSLMRFKPDWSDLHCLPIAPLNTPISTGKWYHSCGCDGMSEVAHYLVQMQGERSVGGVTEYMTENNAPRGGRSGGGLFTDDGFLIGICSRGGGSTGLWSSLQQIHKFLKEEGYGFVLQGYLPARNLNIVDRNTPQKKYPKTFIPIPRFGQTVFGITLP